MTRYSLNYILFFILIFSSIHANGLTKNDVLSVQNGIYYLDGAPFAEIGWNKFDINWLFFDEVYAGRTLTSSNSMLIKQQNSIKELADAGVKTIRFFGCVHPNVFYTKWLPAYNDPIKRVTMCNAAMDSAIASCEKYNIRAIISLMCDNFVDITTTPAENVRELVADPNSKSRILLYDYLNHVINRYKNKRAVLAWEISNEMTLTCDINPGSRISSSGERLYTHAQLSQFYKDICLKIKSYDPLRMVVSGGSVLREMAYGLSQLSATQTAWPTRDTYTQHQSMYKLIYDNSGFDNVDIHFYSKKAPNYQILSDAGTPLILNPSIYNSLVSSLAKPMMLGEYGALPAVKTDANYWLTGADWFETFAGESVEAQKYVQEAAERAVNSGCRLIYWWCYDSQRPQDQADPQRMDLDKTRTPLLFQKVLDANKRLKAKYNIVSELSEIETRKKVWLVDNKLHFDNELVGKVAYLYNQKGVLLHQFSIKDDVVIVEKGFFILQIENLKLKIFIK